MLLLLVAVFAICACSALDSEASAFCDLMKFKPECNSTVCTGESVEAIDKNVCGLITDESGHIIMASASNAVQIQEDNDKLDLNSVSQLIYLKSLYLYGSGISQLPDDIGNLKNLEKL